MDHSKPYFPNLLLVSGNGRNSGKTTFITRIINHFKEEHDITGIKISPHFHDPHSDADKEHFPYIIKMENDLSGKKDSSRMLLSGAKEVFYIQSKEDKIVEAFSSLAKNLDKDQLWICESGGLRNFIRPALFLIISKKGNMSWKTTAKNLLQYSDKTVFFDGQNFSLSLNNIIISGNTWKLLGF